MPSEWKIEDVFNLTEPIGPVIMVDMPKHVNQELPAKASVVVDSVETQQIEIRPFDAIIKFTSIEAIEAGRRRRTFRTSELVERNAGREWVLRIES